jgi:hypothetical protein
LFTCPGLELIGLVRRDGPLPEIRRPDAAIPVMPFYAASYNFPTLEINAVL